ncbi:MAG: type II secretion system protein [bacterium]|nr:type II secretion system protein [bacterium]
MFKKIYIKLDNSQKGELLIESMIAISIIVIGLLGIFTLLSESQSLNRVLSDRYIATYLASEGIEIVKNKIDTNYINNNDWSLGLSAGLYLVNYNGSISLLSANPPPLRYDDGRDVYSYASGDDTRFTRYIRISYPFDRHLDGSNDEMRVNSIVNWTTRGGGDFEINLEDHFFNWR